MAYKGIYKCRLCGEKYVSVSVPNTKAVVNQFLGLTIKEYRQPQQIDITEMHSCGHDRFGLADFQGFIDWSDKE